MEESAAATDSGEENGAHQKIGFAKQLASCDKTTRDRAVRLLESWLIAQSGVSEKDLKKIWKGLFYCVWHADKRHVQAEVIEKLAALIRTLDVGLARDYFQVFILTMRREWSGIDHLRLDKFYLMLRRFLHYVFVVLDGHGWEISVTQCFMRVLTEWTFLAVDKFPARGINLHYVDVYLNEIAEFLPLRGEVYGFVFEPLYEVLARANDRVLVDRVKCNVFDCLVEKGQKLVKLRRDERDGKEVDEDDDDNKNVEKFGCIALTTGIGKKLLELATAESTVQANRKVLYALHEEFGKLEKHFLASGVSVFSGRAKRPRISTEEEAGRGFGNQQVEDKMEIGEEDRLEAGNVKKKVKKTKKAKKALDGANQEAYYKMEIAEEGCLEIGNRMKKIKKRKSKKVNKTVNDKENIAIYEEGSLGTGNGVKKDKKGKTKKGKSNKAEEDATDSNGVVLTKKKKLKASSELREKKVKSQLKAQTSAAEETMTDNGVNEEQSIDLLNVNNGTYFEFGDSVISNLQKEFEKVAAELGENMDMDSCCLPVAALAAPASPGLKKRKRATKILKEVGMSPILQDGGGATGSLHPNGVSSCGRAGEKTAKKVRFAMKRNIVWKPSSPLPPESLRMPPSATPRGSALKKGVPPGPIRNVKELPSPPRRVLLALSRLKARKKLKSISPGTKLVRKRQLNVWKTNSV